MSMQIGLDKIRQLIKREILKENKKVLYKKMLKELFDKNYPVNIISSNYEYDGEYHTFKTTSGNEYTVFFHDIPTTYIKNFQYEKYCPINNDGLTYFTNIIFDTKEEMDKYLHNNILIKHELTDNNEIVEVLTIITDIIKNKAAKNKLYAITPPNNNTSEKRNTVYNYLFTKKLSSMMKFIGESHGYKFYSKI